MLVGLFSCKATSLTISLQQAVHTKGKNSIGSENCKKNPLFKILFKTNIGAKNARKNPIFKSNIKATLLVQNKSKPIKNYEKNQRQQQFYFSPLTITSIFYNTHFPELYLLPNKYKHTGHTSEWQTGKLYTIFIP